MTPRRLRLLTILAIPVFASLTLLSVTQTWWTVEVTDRSLDIAGTVASPALSALSLASFALTAALAIAGPVFRIVMGLLQTAIGATVILAAYNSVHDPIATSASIITEATGVLSPTKKGLSVSIARLPELRRLLAEAEVKARELGWIGDDA